MIAKKPTRFKVEFVDAEGVELWEALIAEYPPWEIRRVLDAAGITVRRTSPTRDKEAEQVIYSELDPVSSIEAAHEYISRTDNNNLAHVLQLLLARRNQWVQRSEIRAVGGDQGDRRVRALRKVGWPIETMQEAPRKPWSVRLVLPAFVPWDETLF